MPEDPDAGAEINLDDHFNFNQASDDHGEVDLDMENNEHKIIEEFDEEL